MLSIKNIIRGLLTLTPNGKLLLPKQVTGGTNSAYYRYEVECYLSHCSYMIITKYTIGLNINNNWYLYDE